MAQAKAKKMTAKEFKEALTAAGIYFDIMGFEGLLNTLSIAESNAAREMEKAGLLAGANGHRRTADKIYQILEDRGYYADIV